MSYLHPDAPAVDFRVPKWHDDAACATYRDDTFYPTTRHDVAEPKAVCENRCKVRTICLEAAIARGESWGVHGGVDFERERAELRRRIA